MKSINVTPGAPNVVTVDQDCRHAETVSSAAGSPLDTFALIAGGNIPLGHAIANIDGKAYRFDINNEDHAYAFAGINVNSANTGQLAFIQPEGVVLVPGWNLIPGQVYHVGPAGALTTTPNLTPGHVLLTLGMATSSNTLLLRADDPLYL